MKIVVVGATGLVGQEILKVMEERNFLFDELYLVASARNVGKEILYKNKSIPSSAWKRRVAWLLT